MLVTLETGKLLQEGLGEVQEMIDICDFAVGLSRQLHGLTIASERPDHRMLETWHPYGVCGVISAFNFPGRGVGVERGAGAGVRQRGRLEAVGKDAAFGMGGASAAACARSMDVRPGVRRHRRSSSIGDRARGECARGASGRAPGQRDRVDGHGPRGRRGMRTPIQANASSSSAATTRRSSCPSADLDLAAARDRVRRGRHGRPALHDAAPAVRAPRRLHRPFVERLQAAYASIRIGRSARAGNAGRTADRRRARSTRMRRDARQRDGRRRRIDLGGERVLADR